MVAFFDKDHGLTPLSCCIPRGVDLPSEMDRFACMKGHGSRSDGPDCALKEPRSCNCTREAKKKNELNAPLAHEEQELFGHSACWEG
jgi:hypothetical protein